MKTIEVDRDIYDYLVARAAQPGESPSQVLRRELQIGLPPETIEIDDDTYQFIVSKAATLGESASDILRRELDIEGDPHGDPGSPVVEFHIAAGTGTQAWNTQATMVVAKVGKILRLVNDDQVSHRLHATGAPFPHQAMSVMPGQSVDIPLNAAYDSSVSGPLYDHDTSTNAHFWIKVQAAN